MRANLQQQHVLGDLGAGQAELHAAGVAVRLRTCRQGSVPCHWVPQTRKEQSTLETNQRTSMLCGCNVSPLVFIITTRTQLRASPGSLRIIS